MVPKSGLELFAPRGHLEATNVVYKQKAKAPFRKGPELLMQLSFS